MGNRSPCFAGLSPGQAAPAGEPIRVAVAGAGGQIGYALLPMIARGDMFGLSTRVVLQCLDLNLPPVKENMRGVGMELQDGNFPLLQRAVFCTDDAEAFKDADYAILLGAYPKGSERDRRDVMDKNILIFRTMGHAIEKHSKADCRVVVVGQPANTNAYICAEFAPSRPKEHFYALSRLDHNRAVGQVALWAGKDGQDVGVGDVRNVIIWGNVAGTIVPDIDNCTVKHQPLKQFLKDEDSMLRSSLTEDVRQRGAAIYTARRASSAMSAARAIVNHMHNVHCGTDPNEVVSMGVWSDGSAYGVGKGLFFSHPVTCTGRGKVQIHTKLTVPEAVKAKMRDAERELTDDRDLALQMIKRHDQSKRAEKPPS